MLLNKLAVVYVRVSDYYKQVVDKDGQSLDLQEKQCIQHMESQGFTVVKIYREEGISGKTQFRDQFPEMLEYINSKKNIPSERITGLCFYAVTRLGRKASLILKTVESLESIGCNIFSVSDGAGSSKFMLTVLSGMAEFESAQLAQRTFPMQLYKVKEEGSYQGSRYPPYGYSYTAGTKRLVKVEEQARHVRMIFDYYLNGIGNDFDCGQLKIAKHLNEIGEVYLRKNKNGELVKNHEWTSKRVSDILRNEVYTGTYVFNQKGTREKIEESSTLTDIKYVMSKRSKISRPVKETYKKPESEVVRFENAHEPIVNKEIWQLAKNKLKKNERQHPVNYSRTTSHLLTKILSCPDCGGKVTASTVGGKVYYKCQRASAGGLCEYNMIQESYLLPRIMKVFNAYFEYYVKNVAPQILLTNLINQSVGKAKSDDEDSLRINELESEIEKNEDKYEMHLEEYRNKLIKMDRLIKYRDDIQSINDRLKREINDLRNNQSDDKVDRNEIEILVERFAPYKEVDKYFESLDIYGQIELLSKVVVQVDYKKFAGKKGAKSYEITQMVLNKDYVFPRNLNITYDVSTLDELVQKKYEKARKELQDKLGIEDLWLSDYFDLLMDIESRETIKVMDLNSRDYHPNITEFFEKMNDEMNEFREKFQTMSEEELEVEMRKIKYNNAYRGVRQI